MVAAAITIRAVGAAIGGLITLLEVVGFGVGVPALFLSAGFGGGLLALFLVVLLEQLVALSGLFLNAHVLRSANMFICTSLKKQEVSTKINQKI
jgi:hypothetical protein